MRNSQVLGSGVSGKKFRERGNNQGAKQGWELMQQAGLGELRRWLVVLHMHDKVVLTHVVGMFHSILP